MEAAQSDALVFFGASGDLAFKQIFPALLGLVGDEGVNVPIVGVAKAGWTVEQLKGRAKDSIKQHGGADAAKLDKLLGLLRYVDGDYNDPQTFAEAEASARRRQAAAALSGDSPEPVWRCRFRARQERSQRRRAPRRREALWPRSRVGAGAQPHTARAFSGRLRSFASTIIWARSRSRTSSIRGSPMRCSSRSGTATMFAASRSPWRKPSTFRTAGASTTPSAPFAMWSRITCCKSLRTS